MKVTAQRVRKWALRLFLLGVGIVVSAISIATLAGVGAHDEGAGFVILADLCGVVLVGLASALLLISIFFPSAPPPKQNA